MGLGLLRLNWYNCEDFDRIYDATVVYYSKNGYIKLIYFVANHD